MNFLWLAPAAQVLARERKMGPTRLRVDISVPRSDPGELYKPAGPFGLFALKIAHRVHFGGSDLPPECTR